MPSLVHENKTIEYYLAPSKRRRSIVMRVDRDNRVQVRAPKFTTTHYIEGFIKERINWIIKKQDGFKKLGSIHPVKEFKTGEIFPLFGQDLKLNIERVKKQRKAICKLDGEYLKIFIGDKVDLKFKAMAASAMRDFYDLHLKLKAGDIIEKHSKVLDVNVANLAIGNQKSLWGSCSRRGNIRLNWRLAMMPFDIMEYIVIHEICHLKVHGHCSKFWKVVENLLPDYKERRKWLRQHGMSFFLISDW
jgi:predicted metal-dependent hydrolase